MSMAPAPWAEEYEGEIPEHIALAFKAGFTNFDIPPL